MVRLPKGMDCRDPKQAVTFNALQRNAKDRWWIWQAISGGKLSVWAVSAFLRKQAE